MGTLRLLSTGGGFGAGTGALCLLSSGGFAPTPTLLSPTETTLAFRTCATGRSGPVIEPVMEGRRMRLSSDVRLDPAMDGEALLLALVLAPVLLRLAIAEPNADPSCDGCEDEGGDRARWADPLLVEGPDGVGVPAGDCVCGVRVDAVAVARCNRAEVARFGDTFATRTGLSGEMCPVLMLLLLTPTAERDDDGTCSGDWERAFGTLLWSERMDRVEGVLRLRVGGATSARLTMDDELTRAFRGADAALAAAVAGRLEVDIWRVTCMHVSKAKQRQSGAKLANAMASCKARSNAPHMRQ